VQDAERDPHRLLIGAVPGPGGEADRPRGRQLAHFDQALGRRPGQREQADPEPRAGGVQHAAKRGGLADYRGGDAVLVKDGESPAADGAGLLDRDQRPWRVRWRVSPTRRRAPHQRQRADERAQLGARLGDEDRQVDAAPVKRLVERRRPVEAELDVEGRRGRTEFADDGGQDVVGGVVGRPDDELRAFGRLESLQRLVMDRDDPARLRQQRDPRLGQPRPAAVRFDQGPAERLLQAADVLAYRRLAELKIGGGAVDERMPRGLSAAALTVIATASWRSPPISRARDARELGAGGCSVISIECRTGSIPCSHDGGRAGRRAGREGRTGVPVRP
jgi:hypothetical protein